MRRDGAIIFADPLVTSQRTIKTRVPVVDQGVDFSTKAEVAANPCCADDELIARRSQASKT
jgi:hypothetical protein